MKNNNFNVILFRPLIPPNTGNIIRLCSNTNSNLYLIKPLGFEVDDRSLLRAGLDYHKNVNINIQDTLESCIEKIGRTNLYLVTKFGKKKYSEVNFNIGDTLLFGSEVNGLPKKVIDDYGRNKSIYIPMTQDNRSLNLSNSVSICLYEAWKQNNFKLS